MKLEDYWTKLEASPAFLAAVVLNPRLKWDWVEDKWAANKDWIKDGKAEVESLWQEYKSRVGTLGSKSSSYR